MSGLAPIVDDRWSRRFSGAYDRVFEDVERTFLGPLRSRLVGGLRGRVVEIGAGTGANVGHYRAADRVDLVEPLPSMRARLDARLASREASREPTGEAPGMRGIPMQVTDGRAEALPFPDASADAVVSTLVLCSVSDVERTLDEVRRVLAPGGVFAFLEHSRGRGLKRGVQTAITPVTRRLCGNCHHDRDLAGAIGRAGFDQVEAVPVPSPLRVRVLPEWPLVAGHASDPLR